MQVLENIVTAHVLACAIFVFFGLPASALISFSLTTLWWLSITTAFMAVMYLNHDCNKAA